ncbi:hypothetical protein DFJ74DRAFT_601809 [Hyaloraphidium curvatum]|nr:hypothetical protein DFJ74DRAFT_601809 [Hyaloraphidium curvatum]
MPTHAEASGHPGPRRAPRPPSEPLEPGSEHRGAGNSGFRRSRGAARPNGPASRPEVAGNSGGPPVEAVSAEPGLARGNGPSRKAFEPKLGANGHPRKPPASGEPRKAPDARPPSGGRPSGRGGKRLLPVSERPDADDLMTKLVRGLTTGTYECYICYSNVAPAHQTWACSNCFAVFHLNCISQWARKSMPEPGRGVPGAPGATAGFRCPGCNFSHTQMPSEYRCMCGKTVDPPQDRNVTPHCCGSLCLGQRPEGCVHECLHPCHPGPHPPCSQTIHVPCHCGKAGFTLRCGSGGRQISCGQVCGKLLGCGSHSCEAVCHAGPCEPCAVSTDVSCWCGKESKNVACGSKDQPLDGFSCQQVCDHAFGCPGHHKCERICHPDAHPAGQVCPFDPSVISTCPCGKNRLEAEARETCLDEILTCGERCDKELPCGHRCRSACHLGECARCDEPLTVACQCGENTMTVVCGEVERKNGELVPPTCEKVCRVLRSCKKHQCGRKCCPVGSKKTPDDPDGLHVCALVCGKPLKCGNHTCEELCHRGFCPPCLSASFEDLSCHCGRTVLFPPIPCGAKPPRCRHNCIRQRDCGHPMQEHECHNDSVSCPPCVVLVEKPCVCERKVFKQACYKTTGGVSCGDRCPEIMVCGHRCPAVCHQHDIDSERGSCTEKCGTPRPVCLHPCGQPCHVGSACDTTVPCQHPMKQTCKCGNRVQLGVCGQASQTRAWRIFLPCDASCEVAERNKRLADALEIDPKAPRIPASDDAGIDYPEQMLLFAKANPTFVKPLEKEFESLILDRTRKSTRMLNHARKTHLAFAQRLAAQFYDLDSEIEDANTQSPGLFLKKRPTSRIPATLVSEAANMPKKVRSAKPAAVASQGTMAVNALHLVNVAWGMDSRSIAILLEPLFGTSFGKPVIHWNGEDDLIVAVKTLSPAEPAQVEQFLRQIRTSVAEKFVSNGWAKAVNLCWVDRTLKIRGEEGAQPKVEEEKAAPPEAQPQPMIGTKNAFDALAKPAPAGGWDDGAGDAGEENSTVDTWEALAD